MNKSHLPRWNHQAKEYQIGREKRSRALIWPMRSGKSRACIDVGCYQFKRGKIEGGIVIAPNGVHLNWARNEIPTWGHTDMAHATFAWETQKRGFPEKEREWVAMMHSRGMKWLCINMDALNHNDCRRYVRMFLARIKYKFILIVSEAHHFGRAGAKRTKMGRSLSWHAEFVRTETGTPILTGPLRAFAQYELLAPGALGFGTYTEFANHFAEFMKEQRGNHIFKRVARYLNLDELTRKIAQWSSLVLREEIEDLPRLWPIERPVVLSDKCRQSYLEMVTRHLTEIGDDMVTAKEGGARMMKLQQILHGYIRDTDNQRIIEIDPDAAIYDALMEEIDGTVPGKVLVWCRYKEDIRRVGARLKKRGMKWLEYSGNITSAAERERNRIQFNGDPAIDAMLGTPDAGGEGLDFSGADAVIFFSIPPNARLIAQAQERATVKGGKAVPIIRIRHYGTVDDRLWQIVDGNVSLADAVTGHGLRKILMETDI